jgi:hypothetical protein
MQRLKGRLCVRQQSVLLQIGPKGFRFELGRELAAADHCEHEMICFQHPATTLSARKGTIPYSRVKVQAAWV